MQINIEFALDVLYPIVCADDTSLFQAQTWFDTLTEEVNEQENIYMWRPLNKNETKSITL